MSDKRNSDAGGSSEGGATGSEAGGAGQGNTLKDLSDETVREMEKRKDGAGHAGTGDYG